jgi:hypothetical protein
MRLNGLWGLLVLALAACGDGGGGSSCIKIASTRAGGSLFTPAEPPNPLVQVSGDSPFARGCGREEACGTVYVGAEVEPHVAINPIDSRNLVGVWQQDRWSNGGAQGLLAAFTSDGGETWNERQVPFSRCSGGNALNGGDYARATDPWVTIGADGTVYWMAMTISDLPDNREVSAMRVSRSTDGGDTWDAPVTLIEDVTPFFNDKNAMTADPTDANYVYAVWGRLDYASNKGPAYYSRTTDGGETWSPAAVLYDPGSEAQTVGNQVVVLSDGTVLNLFTQVDYGTATTPDLGRLRVIRSEDHGASWVDPVTIAMIHPRGAYDPETGQPIRDGSILGTIAVAPDDTVWVAWQDARIGLVCAPESPCYWPYDRIALVKSTDGGLSWSEPVVVNAETGVPAFTPSLSVAADGVVALSYYDMRDNTSDPGTALVSRWLATSIDGTAWTEALISGPFDINIAPHALGLFLGDYQGLVTDGSTFVPFFAATTASLADRTNIYVQPLPAGPVAAKRAGRTYTSTTQGWIVPDPDGAARVAENIRRQRMQQFPDKIRPDIPAHLLR